MPVAWVDVDLGAIRDNARVLAAAAAPAAVCAVVKADGYGHGAVPVARAALEGGATWLAVALVDEGRELRRHGVDAPVLLLYEPGPDEADEAVRLGLRPTVYTADGVRRVAAAAARVAAEGPGPGEAPGWGQPGPVPVHLEVDTGMHRVGCAPAEAVELARAVAACPALALEGVWTHLAVAEDLAHGFTGEQLGRFSEVVDALEGAGVRPPVLHVANSAGVLAHPRSHHAMVRAGIALYGLAPGPDVPGPSGPVLRPALGWRTAVSFVQRVPAGDAVSYGLRHRFERATWVASVPVGYADGVPRRAGEVGVELLVGGRRRTVVGTVTMDHLMVDCGDDAVAVGDEVVLIGRQGLEHVTADEWAARLGTINYEVVTGIRSRVARRYTS